MGSTPVQHSVLNVKAVVAAFNQEKALVGAFSVIVQPVVEPMEHYTALLATLLLCRIYHQNQRADKRRAQKVILSVQMKSPWWESNSLQSTVFKVSQDCTKYCFKLRPISLRERDQKEKKWNRFSISELGPGRLSTPWPVSAKHKFIVLNKLSRELGRW